MPFWPITSFGPTPTTKLPAITAEDEAPSATIPPFSYWVMVLSEIVPLPPLIRTPIPCPAPKMLP